MADAVEEEIENALNFVVSTAEQSSNMRKALKEKIFETVSALRQLFVKIKISGDRNLSDIDNLTKKVSKLETELKRCREKQAEVQQTPSIADTTEQSGPRARLHGTIFVRLTSVPAEVGAQKGALPTGNMSRQYATVVKEAKSTKYKMAFRSRSTRQPEEIKQLLKTKINPGEINVGVNTLKSLNGGVLIETNSLEEIEVLGKEIQTKCG
jgi:hypothetical protein